MKTRTDHEALMECQHEVCAALDALKEAIQLERDEDPREASEKVLHAQGNLVVALSWMTKLLASL